MLRQIYKVTAEQVVISEGMDLYKLKLPLAFKQLTSIDNFIFNL